MNTWVIHKAQHNVIVGCQLDRETNKHTILKDDEIILFYGMRRVNGNVIFLGEDG